MPVLPKLQIGDAHRQVTVLSEGHGAFKYYVSGVASRDPIWKPPILPPLDCVAISHTSFPSSQTREYFRFFYFPRLYG
jgi:hypothetical protein